MISAGDLHENPVLIRKIKRMQKAEAQRLEEAEDSDMDDDAPRNADDSFTQDDSSLQVPVTQQPPRSSEVVDLGDPSDEDEDDD